MINKKSLDIRIRPRIFAKLMLPVQGAKYEQTKVRLPQKSRKNLKTDSLVIELQSNIYERLRDTEHATFETELRIR
jgi:hypothetical protein